jgi:hypothetical protein
MNHLVRTLLSCDPALVWGLCARLLAIVYVVAFLSLRADVLGIAGARGLNPVALRLAAMRADLGPWRAAARQPTLLWLAASDRVLELLPLAGAAAALCAAIGILSPLMLGLSWLIYLSFDVAVGLCFPWEVMLLESGFLAMFLPASRLLPALGATAPPAPVLMFAFHWLLFRVVLGFGKFKFTREALKDPNYLRGFLIGQPLVSPLGWIASRWPRPLLVVSYGLLFCVEMPLPFLVFFPGWPRLIAFVGFATLMIGIQLMGNFGFFNLLTIVIGVTLLDPRSVLSQPTALLQTPSGVLIATVAAWSVLAGLCHFFFNSWVARGWLEWPAWGALRGLPRGLFALLRATMPLRTVGSYGVFPPRSGPPLKYLPVLEGTRDGDSWEAFEFRYMPSTPRSPPVFVAPHAPRIDHFLLYEGLGLGIDNFLYTVINLGSPYDFSSVSTMDRLLERVMDPQSPVRRFFRSAPFGGEPPLQVRMRLFLFAPTTPEERRATGDYWQRILVGEHARARGPDPTLFRRWLAAPVQLHPDERFARRRVPGLEPLRRATTMGAVRDALDDDTRARWELFWDELAPAVRRASAIGWGAIVELSRRWIATHGPLVMNELDRVRGAVATALLEKMDPHVLGHARPALSVPSYFHAALRANTLLFDGQARCGEILADRSALLDRASSAAEEPGLMLLAVFYPDSMVAHARKYRLLRALTLSHPAVPAVVPGFHLVLPALAAGLPDPEERLPHLVQLPSGEWELNGAPLPLGSTRTHSPRAGGTFARP